MESHNNPADWATKPRAVRDLQTGGFWQKGPDFLEEDVIDCPTKLDFRTDKLEGEIQPKGVNLVLLTAETCNVLDDLLRKHASSAKLFRILGYAYKYIGLVRNTDVRVPGILLKEEILKSKITWIHHAQRELDHDLNQSIEEIKGKSKVLGRYRRLAPFKDVDGVWRVGARVGEFTPFTEDNKPPALLPKDHKLTRILMTEAHQKRHSGVSDTVGQFRLAGFWTPKANRSAKEIKQACVIC